MIDIFIQVAEMLFLRGQQIKKKYVKLENDPGQVIGPNQQFEEKNSA